MAVERTTQPRGECPEGVSEPEDLAVSFLARDVLSRQDRGDALADDDGDEERGGLEFRPPSYVLVVHWEIVEACVVDKAEEEVLGQDDADGEGFE